MEVIDVNELLIVAPEVFLYDIPPETDKLECGRRAADWDVSKPVWQGIMFIFAAGPSCQVELNDRKGNVYGQAVIEEYPGELLKPVVDSSRFFTLEFKDDKGNSKLSGMGFIRQEDSFELKHVLKGYFTANKSWKRRIEKGLITEASAPKKIMEDPVKLIHTKTSNPAYKYRNEEKNVFQCHQCEKTFFLAQGLVKHWREDHWLETSELCSFCQLPFAQREERVTHTSKIHPGAPISKSPEPVMSVCPIESKVDEQKTVIPRRLRLSLLGNSKRVDSKSSHTPTKAILKCSNCGEGFSTLLPLIRHFKNLHSKVLEKAAETGSVDSRVHSGGNQEKETAEYIYSKTNDPDYNYIEGKLFKCHVCAEKFDNLQKFNCHWTEVHKFQVYVCKCLLPFPLIAQFNRHKRFFHGYKCSMCKNICSDESGLENHYLNSHQRDLSGKKIIAKN